MHHPAEEGNTKAFQFTLAEKHSQPLTGLTSESCYIHDNDVDIPMNSKAEWHQPAVGRVAVLQDLQDLSGPEGRGRGTVRSLAPICRSPTSTIVSEPIFRQSHTVRQRQINSNEYSV